MLVLFGGSGFISEAALRAGASVVHVDSDPEALRLARERLGSDQVSLVSAHVPLFVEGAERRGERFDFITATPPRVGHGPGGEAWDIEVDLPRVIRELRHLVSDQCRGIWVAVDTRSWTAASVGQMLRDALPGRTIELADVFVATADGRQLPAGGAARWFDAHEFVDVGQPPPPFTHSEVEEHLDAYLDAVLSSRRTATEPARRLAALARQQQDFVLHWVSVVAHTNAEMAYQLAAHAAEAFEHLDTDGVEAWLIHAMDVYDTRGLHAGIAVLQNVEGFAREMKARASGLAFDEVAPVLETFVRGLAGRRLALEQGEATWTDTETLYLPAMVSRFETREANFQYYKAMACLLWAQTWYGTWREDLQARAGQTANPRRALALFRALECLRLEACVERELPGVGRQLQALRERLELPAPGPEWSETLASLRAPGATTEDVWRAVEAGLEWPLPETAPWHGEFFPDRVEEVRALRLARDREALRRGLLKMQEELGQPPAGDGEDSSDRDGAPADEPRLKLREIPDQDLPDGFTYEIVLDGRPVPPPDDVKGTMQSILQDLGQIPDDYLVAAGDGAYHAEAGSEEPDPSDVWKGTYHEEGAFLYNEWDYERQHYRKNWAVLRELEVHPRQDDFVRQTLDKYRGLVKSLRRTFEALRGEDKLLKKQPHGDDIDIDALVEAHADVQAGQEMTDRLFTKMHKLERNIAVMFMVDMSGSTKGWINDAEREALVLLCESLETLGDRYAIYGFSGMTRKRCEVYRVKRFDEPYDDEVQARISGIQPQDYTRMGVAIRHLSRLLNEVDARTRLLITLSDGKPDDYDSYRGQYGIEDTRQALIEARRDGIHPFCITIDTEARDYLPHMYGAVNYAVIDAVQKLPLKVSDIYRRLTT